LASERPFKGETTVSVISSILKDSPPAVTELNPSMPFGVAKVIRRSLAKDPSRRYQTAIDLRNDLEDLKGEVDSGISTSAVASSPRIGAPPRRRLRLAALAAAGVILLTAIAFTYSYLTRPGSVRTDGFLAIDRPARLTNSGNAALAAISADGRYVAHVKDAARSPALWMRQTATASDVQIVAPQQVRYDGVTFSPDGNYVYYVTYTPSGGVGTLYRIPGLGGTPEKVLEDVDSRVTFSPDRRQFAFTRGAPAQGTAYVMIANADGTGVRQAAELKIPDQFSLNAPAWSSDGKTIVAPVQSLRNGPHALVAGIDVASGKITPLAERWNLVADLEWVPGTDTFMAVASELGQPVPQLWQIKYPSGERRRITSDLNSYASLSLSADATSLATVQTESVANLWIVDTADFRVATPLTEGRGRADGINGISWMPDGRIVFVSTAVNGQQAWIADADGRNVRQLTAAPQEPVFGVSATPDGRYIVFQRLADSHMRIWRMNADGSDQRQLTDGTLDLKPVAGPGGNVYFGRVVAGIPRPFKVSIEGGPAVALGEYHFRPTGISADGSQLIGVTWNPEQKRSVLALMPSSGGQPALLSKIPIFLGGLSPDGKAVMFPMPQAGGVQLNRYDIATDSITSVGTLPGFVFEGAMSPDGKRLALSRGEVLSDVLLLTMRPRGE
jgi:eukaryotic-like serine/threonine-protein kinase